LDEATLRIAQRMLSTPPKPHDEMKVGTSKIKRGKAAADRKVKKKSRSA